MCFRAPLPHALPRLPNKNRKILSEMEYTGFDQSETKMMLITDHRFSKR